MNPLDKKPFIIGDVGSNHRGDLELAKAHIRVAKDRGLNAVKIQMYTHKELYGYDGEMPFELPRDWIPVLSGYAKGYGIEFMCTAFSLEGLQYVDKFVNIHKVASSESTWNEFIEAASGTGKQVIISTAGLCHEQIMGLVGPRRFFLQCVGAYPARSGDYNLKSIHSNLHDGLSDHTRGSITALVALGCGATIFEKHFDIYEVPERPSATPDTPVSASPRDLDNYVKRIHQGYNALGDGVKRCMPCEEDFPKYHHRRMTEHGMVRLKKA